LRVHVGDSELVQLLLDYFEEQADCIAMQVGETDIEVSLLGSYGAEAHDAAVEQLVSQFRLRGVAERRRPGLRSANGDGPH
jgi:hypothetical protein